MATKVLVPSGVLGLSFDREALWRGIEAKPDIIAIDGGSTDSGPFYLGAGVSKYSRSVTYSEWKILLEARKAANVPLILTSAGTCGTDSCVDWMLNITSEVASSLGQTLRVATIKSSQDKAFVAKKFDEEKVFPLIDAPRIEKSAILNCRNIVALAGVEQIIAALNSSVDVIIAGRATDTSGIAALPVYNKEHIGAAWHGAKIGECGALCASKPMSGVICVEFDESGFEVEPLAQGACCTTYSVSAHMLYENADPFILTEPGGTLDVSMANYVALNERRVRVEGSIWKPSDRYTVKLEGALLSGFQSTTMVILRDERYTANATEWSDKLSSFLQSEIPSKTGISTDRFKLDFRHIGLNSALGSLDRRVGKPLEVGVLCIVTAECQAEAYEIAKLMNPYMLHFPLSDDESLPTFAFPYSPAETERGPVFEFCLNHTMELADPLEAFRLETHEIVHA